MSNDTVKTYKSHKKPKEFISITEEETQQILMTLQLEDLRNEFNVQDFDEDAKKLMISQ